jgi:deoxyribodipyrimidine photo-lyase
MTRALVWFRRDLRVHDHTALSRAAADCADGLVAVWAITPAFWRDHDDAPAKIDLWLRCARDLSAALAARNVPLVVLTASSDDDLAAQLVSLAQRARCGALYFHREFEVDEARRDDRVTARFAAAGVAVHRLDDRTLVPPEALRTTTQRPYTVFTPYRRAWTTWLQTHGAAVLPPIGVQKPVEVVATEIPASVEGFASPLPAHLWPSGEAHAHTRLARFAEGALSRYDTARDLPAEDGTSALSPYLAAGVLSARQCLAAALAANQQSFDGSPGPRTWISELAWRDFYNQVVVHFPRVSRGRCFQRPTEAVRWRDAPEDLARWQAGETGFPLVDAAMKQLVATGWMHNRLRMLTAMFLTKDLLLDWRHGERFFMRHLVDGDLAANNGGWQWSASTGTDAQPWFRVFNPWTQSARFDPDGAFVKRWLPALKPLSPKALHAMHALPSPQRAVLGYPAPMVDHAAARLRALAAFEALRDHSNASTVPQ